MAEINLEFWRVLVVELVGIYQRLPYHARLFIPSDMRRIIEDLSVWVNNARA